MNLDRVTSGQDVPNDVNVIIEIPAHADPVKYEVDKETGAMFVGRFMNTAMHYPCNYGYVPHTLSPDGDPVDVLVVTPIPLISGQERQGQAVLLMAAGAFTPLDEFGFHHALAATRGTALVIFTGQGAAVAARGNGCFPATDPHAQSRRGPCRPQNFSIAR